VKILIIEDDRSLLMSINDYLKMEGHICEVAQNFNQGLIKAGDNRYDCIILDIGLPDGNGLNIIRELKANKVSDGILILSAKSSLDDKLLGLKIGADDYLTKPFHFSGLNEINFNEIKVNMSDKQAFVNNELLNLTRKEYDLLLFFLTNSNRIITKESIVEHLWGDQVILTDSFDFVYTHVKNLRKKIKAAGSKNYIKCIYGFGYKFLDN
jgi:DNA-binding response OmpR family regulator